MYDILIIKIINRSSNNKNKLVYYLKFQFLQYFILKQL